MVSEAIVIGAAAAPLCTPVLVTPPLLDTQVAVCLVIALPLFAGAPQLIGTVTKIRVTRVEEDRTLGELEVVESSDR